MIIKIIIIAYFHINDFLLEVEDGDDEANEEGRQAQKEHRRHADKEPWQST